MIQNLWTLKKKSNQHKDFDKTATTTAKTVLTLVRLSLKNFIYFFIIVFSLKEKRLYSY